MATRYKCSIRDTNFKNKIVSHFSNYFLIALFAVACMLPHKLYGQPSGFGVKAGIAFSNIKLVDATQYPDPKPKGKVGFIVGVFSSIPISDHFHFRPEVNFIEKGYIVNKTYPEPLPYLDFPLNLLLRFKAGKGHYYIGTGPEIGVSLKRNYLYNEPPTNVDIGINGLVGYQSAIGFSFDLNYTHGFSKIESPGSFDQKFTNRYFGITLGYSF